MSKVWTTNPGVLLSKQNLRYFIPTDDMTYVEKINAITRFIIYGSVLLYLIRGDINVFLIPIVGMVIMYFLVSWGVNLDELKESFGDKSELSCVKPTLNNPFMNVLPTDDRTRGSACKYTKDVKKEINNSFNSNLYLDLGDIYEKNNSQRQFYTMPSTQIPNNQEEFAKWLYNSKPICKEGNC
tara:strand:+ start:761 stop:1309 length:549 start_codon:yes stop_codon:yes gene_type:complete